MQRFGAYVDTVFVFHSADQCPNFVAVDRGYVGVTQHGQQRAVVKFVVRPTGRLALAFLQLQELLNEAVQRGVAQRIAHRHVHPPDVGGQGVQHRKE